MPEPKRRNPSKWLMMAPAVGIAGIAVHGVVAHSLVPLQVTAWVLAVYNAAVFSWGAYKYKPARQLAAPVLADELYPKVSILVPCHNEEAVIELTVANMLAIDYPDFEVVVIDDHSTDSTAGVLAEVVAKHPQVRVVTRRNLPDRGKSEALNSALAIADGEFLCVFDADSQVAPDFLRRAVTPMVLDPNVVGVQAQVRLYNKDQNFLTAGQDDEFAIFSELSAVGRDSIRGACLLGGNGQLTRRSAVMALGGWSPKALTEDLDLTMRLWLAGLGRVAHAADAVVWQEGVPKVKALIRQRTRWAEGTLRCFGEYMIPMLMAPHLTKRMKFDGLYALGTAYYPLITAVALFFSAMWGVNGGFQHSLPQDVSNVFNLTMLACALGWALTVGWKRDGNLNPLPGLRYILYMLIWIPAVMGALRNVMRRTPSVWAKTEHSGHGLRAPMAPVSMAPVAAGVSPLREASLAPSANRPELVTQQVGAAGA